MPSLSAHAHQDARAMSGVVRPQLFDIPVLSWYYKSVIISVLPRKRPSALLFFSLAAHYRFPDLFS